MRNTPNSAQYVLFIALMAGIGAFVYWHGEAKQEAKLQELSTDLTRMTMPQAIAHCRAMWAAGQYDQAPLAFAWHKEGLDWYVLDGTDETSMRHYSCDGTNISKGARYERVMGRLVPPPGSEPRDAISRNLFTHYAAQPDAGLIAFEATEHPVTRELIERRWTASGVVPTGAPDPKDFPTLFRTQPAGVTTLTAPLLKPAGTAINWVAQPARVFALLEQHLPPNARIAELEFGDRSIRVRIVGPIKNSESNTPSAFGDASFDEYGKRDTDWWYPRDQTGSSCSPGHTLKEVAGQFAAANANNSQLLSASFSCRGRKGEVYEVGSWTLRVPRRR